MSEPGSKTLDGAAGEPRILTINGGSSSIRFALYRGAALARALHGKIDRIGLAGTVLTMSEPGRPDTQASIAGDRAAVVAELVDRLQASNVFASLDAVGHRVVHGMQHAEPERVSEALLRELHRIGPYDPNHLPLEIELIEALRQRLPELPQFACFDTAFHRSMPPVARLIAIPRRFQAEGVQRYGFHGLSYAYLLEELARLGDAAATTGRVILAHLGNGASMAAILDGRSIDTSMGFTPASGLPMSTRSGDLDPGLFGYLCRTGGMSAAQFDRMANEESGLLGVSGISSDVRDLLAQEGDDPRAAEALDLYCYQAKKCIGAYAAALGGLDTLVFAGGVGENAARIRERICAGLGFLGIALDPALNAQSARLISAADGRLRVRIIRTDEELMIARSVTRLLRLGAERAGRAERADPADRPAPDAQHPSAP
jgi:acetate kinase